MKAILVDPKNKTVEKINLKEGYNLREILGCDCVSGTYASRKDFIYVDDMGLLKENYLFFYNGYPSPLAGKSLILGIGEFGESEDCNLTVQQVKRNIQFISDSPVQYYNSTPK